MKRKLFLGILGIFLALSCAGGAWSDETKGPCTIMKPDRETRLRWIHDYEMAPKAYIDKSMDFRAMPGGSLSLLSHLQYTPSERDQGSCGNCWVWAGTGVAGIALDVQEGIFDRLSVQFLGSCNTAKSCCDGGWLRDLAEFYTTEGYIIPWSNTNASWQNGDGSCNVPCGSIATSPGYDIDSIEAQTIETHGAGQAQAIANIKNVLNQNKAVWLAWFFPRGSDWDTFRSFWNTQGETVTTNLDYGCGHTWDSGGGGHAVLCVGYNDDDPENSYWIMLNSWGTAEGDRPNGIFRLDMDMDYGCTFYDDGWYWSYYWQTLDVSFNNGGQVIYVEPSGTCNGNTPCYSTIQGAVDAANSGSTIKIAGGSYGEDVSLSTSKNLIFKGGYNSTFTTQSSETIFQTMTISKGTAVVDKLTLVSTASWPNISYSGSNPYDYGTVAVGSSSDHAFPIQNTGSATLNISGASASGTGFSVVGSVPGSISAGGSDTITVRFAPGSVGSYTGTLSINSDDPDTPTLNIGLSGTGDSAPQQVANIVFRNNLLCFGSPFTATLTIDGQALTSSGMYSDCEEFDCGASLNWKLYATSLCGTITGQGSKTYDCDCLYKYRFLLIGSSVYLVASKSCPGDCSDVSSVSIGSMKLLDSVVLTNGATPSGLTIHDPTIAD